MMLRNEFYGWLAFTLGLALFATVAAIAFLMGADYGVGLGLLIALLCGVVFGGWHSWRLHQEWERYQRRLQRRQLPIIRRLNRPTDQEYWGAVQQAREVVIHWAVDRAEECVQAGHCRDCEASHNLLQDYPWDPSLHRAGCSAQQVMAQFSEITLAPMIELLQCEDIVFLDRLQGQARTYLIQCIQYALAELPEGEDPASVLQYIAQEYRRFAEQQESPYGTIELGRKLVQEVMLVDAEIMARSAIAS
jgi:hypothetical protein